MQPTREGEGRGGIRGCFLGAVGNDLLTTVYSLPNSHAHPPSNRMTEALEAPRGREEGPQGEKLAQPTRQEEHRLSSKEAS